MGNEEYVSMHRRQLLQSAGVMGGLSGLLGSGYGVGAANGSVAQEAEEIELVDIAGELFSELVSRFTAELQEFFSPLSGDALIDALEEIGEYVPGSSQLMSWIDDIVWIYEQGEEFVRTLTQARANAEDEEEESDGDSGNDKRAGDASGSGKRAGYSASTSTSAGAFGGGWGLPEVPSWDDIAPDVQSELEELVDDVSELREHLPDLSPAALMENIVDKLAEWIAEPLGDITNLFPEDPLSEPFQMGLNFPSFDGLDVSATFDMPAGTFELPDGVYGPEAGDGSERTSSMVGASAGGRRGFGATPGSKGSQSTDPEYWAKRATATPPVAKSRAFRGTQEVVAPLPTLEDCPAARGQVVAIPFIIRLFRDPTRTFNAQLGFWVGAEPGRPCLYWADQTEVSVGVNPVDLFFAANANQDELNAAGHQLEGYLESLSDRLQRVYDEGRDITFAELQSTVASFLESSVPEMRRILSEIGGTLESVLVDDLIEELETLESDLQSFLDGLADWELPAQLSELQDAIDDVDPDLEPPSLTEVTSILAAPAIASGAIGVDTFGEVRNHASSVASWLDELEESTYRSLQDRTPYDLGALRAELTDLDHPVFELAQQIGGQARRILEVTIFAMKREITSRLKERAPEWEIDLLPDLGCHATCSELYRPVSALAWVVQQIIEIGVAIQEFFESLITWLPPAIRSPVALILAVALLLFLIVDWAAFGILGEIGSTSAPGVGNLAFAAIYIVATAVLLAGLPAVFRYYTE